jgi:hypothetical protein
MFAFLGVAHAASVAVLDFDGYGVSRDEALAASEALRERFLAEGLLDPLSGSDIAGGVSRGQDTALRRARELVGAARSALDGGDTEGAVALLDEAIALHERAWSDVGRRAELADARWLCALALLKAGRATEARAHAAEAVFLHPRYGRDRASQATGLAAELLRDAEAEVARAPRRVRPAADLADIGETLEVDFVVAGWLADDGRVRARLYAGPRLLGEATATLDQLPPLREDPAWTSLALELGGAAGAVPVVEPEDAPDLDEEPARATDDPVARKPAGTRVTDQWWFWTGAFLAVGGAGTLVGYALWEPPVEVVDAPDTWTVRVAVE